MKFIYFLLATVLCPMVVEAQNKVSVQPDATIWNILIESFRKSAA